MRAPCNGTSTPPKLVVTLAPHHSTLQWHPPIAPRPLPQSWSSPSIPPPPKHTTMAPCNGTQQWHHVHSPKVGRHPPPPPQSTLQWHPAMAPSNRTTSTPLKLVVTLPTNHSTLQWHPAMAPRPVHPAIAPWCHVQSAKVVRRPPPLLEVRTPIAITIWGTKAKTTTGWLLSGCLLLFDCLRCFWGRG